MVARPRADVEPLADNRFRAISKVPELALDSCHGWLPTGWVEVGYRIDAGRRTNPILIAESPTDPNSPRHYPLPQSRGAPLRSLLRLPGDTSGLVLRPCGFHGPVRVEDLTIRELNGAILALRLLVGKWAVVSADRARLWRAVKDLVGLLLAGPERFKEVLRFQARHPGVPYDDWYRTFVELDDADRRAIARHVEAMEATPSFSVLIRDADTAPQAAELTRASLREQSYPNWRYHEDGATPPNFVVLLDAGDRLSEHALYMIASEIAARPECDLVYADEDIAGSAGEGREGHFKPDWNLEMLRSWNYIGSFSAIRWDAFITAGGLAVTSAHDLHLRIAENSSPGRMRHLPFVLCHRSAERRSSTDCGVVAAHLDRLGISADVVEGPTGARARVIYDLPEDPPKVSLIVPTRDRVDLLRVCVDGVRTCNDYANWELIIVDNGSVEPGTAGYLQELTNDPRISVIRDDGPFNFSALNNRAAVHANGEIIGLLNNDIEPINPDWLVEMVRQISQVGVGAVGAKLYYPDDTIQHAGVVIGVGGVAGHFDKRLARGADGYFGRAVTAHDVSAVTAACMLVKREVFEAVGGLDEEGLAIAFNDVDLCLKIRAAGHRIVWTPHAELYHHESVSRGDDTDSARHADFKREQQVFAARWGEVIAHDPHYNPNLTLERERPELAIPPRVTLPWEPYFEPPA